MTTSGVNLTEGGNLVAGADFSSKQFYAVKANSTARTLVIASTGGENITGILQNNPASGEACEVVFDGFCKAAAGASFTAGQALMTDNTGRLVTQTSTNAKVAVAHETAGGAGEIVLVRVLPTPG